MASLFNNLFVGNKPENGQLTINLNLTIKIEADGSLSVSSSPAVKAVEKRDEIKPGKTEYLLPDFGDNELIDFGKNV